MDIDHKTKSHKVNRANLFALLPDESGKTSHKTRRLLRLENLKGRKRNNSMKVQQRKARREPKKINFSQTDN